MKENFDANAILNSIETLAEIFGTMRGQLMEKGFTRDEAVDIAEHCIFAMLAGQKL